MNRLKYHHDSAPPSLTQSHAETPAVQGFDAEFTDLVDYILRITRRIWEGKQVGLCLDYYTADCPVYTLSGVTIGAAEVTQNTLATLASFPDRSLNAMNIICGGDAIDGFHSSHLISSHMTNLGDSDWGPATGREATILVVAHCILKNNQIVEEWLVRDNYSLAQQLGHDPHLVAQAWANKPISSRLANWRNAELERLREQVVFNRVAAGTDAESIIRGNLQNIWNAKMVGDVYQCYAVDACLHGVSGRQLRGQDAIARFYTDILGTLSDLRFSLDYSCQQPSESADQCAGVELAARWTLSGVHTGSALYGPPTGTTLFILGESHYHIVEGLIVEEWNVFDELSVLAEVYRARNAAMQLAAP